MLARKDVHHGWRVAGVEQPIVVQAVHHVLHSLVRLPPRAEAAPGARMATEAAANKALIVFRNMMDTPSDQIAPSNQTRPTGDSCGIRGS